MALTGLTKIQKVGISTTTIPTLGGSENVGVVTATNFIGDGSGLSNVTGSGAGVIVRDGGSLVGTAGTINFGTNLNVSAISAGIVTVTNAVSASALTNLSDVTVSSASNGQILKHNGSVFVNTAETTYSQSSVASGSNVNLRLTDSGGTNDDILITAGSNITFSSVSAGGFTIAASGGGGGGLSNVVEDTTPELGGNLNLNNKYITGSGGANISGVVTATSFVGNITGDVTGNVTGNISGGTVAGTTGTFTGNVALGDSSSDTISMNGDVNTNIFPSTNGNKDLGDSGNRWGEVHAVTFHGSGVNLSGVVTSIVAGSNISLAGGPTGIVTISSSGGGGLSLSNGTNNNVVTASSATALNGEGNLTFDGTTLALTGNQTVSGSVVVGTAVTINSDGINVTGVSTFSNGKISFNANGDIRGRYITLAQGDGTKYIDANLASGNQLSLRGYIGNSFHHLADFVRSGLVRLNFSGNERLVTDSAGVKIAGVCTATSFSGLNGTGIVVSGVSTFHNNIVATATTALSITAADESTDTSCNVLFATAASGNVAPKTGSNLTFNSNTGALTAGSFVKSGGSSSQFLKADGSVDSNTYLTGSAGISNVVEDTSPELGGNLVLNGNDITGTGDVNIVGLITATSAVTTWTVGNSGSSHYTFTGNGFTSATNDPDLYLVRGQRYSFIITSGSSHPFYIKTTPGTGTGNQYTTGVTNNGATSGSIHFNVPFDAPAHLYYQCSAHTDMVGNIYIVGQHLANGANNRVLTATSAYGMNGESNLTFDGSLLTTTGNGKFNKTGNCNVLIGSTNAGGAAIVLDGDSDGNGSGADYAYIEHDTSGDLNIVATNPADSSSIKFNTGDGGERLKIESTGQIRIDQATSANNGIRMRPSGWNYDFRIGAVSSSGGNIWLGQNYEPTGATRDNASYGTNYIRFTTSGEIMFGTGATDTNPLERLKIQNNGTSVFDVGAPSSSNKVIGRFQSESSRNLDIVWHDTGSLMGFDTPGNHSYIFKMNGSEKVRIESPSTTILKVGSGTVSSIYDSSGTGNEGAWLVAGGASEFSTSNEICMRLNRKSTTGIILQYRYNGSSVGSVSTGSVNNPSDRNFKANISDLNLGLSFVNKLKPSQFNYKIDEPNTPVMYGLIAQDVEESLTSEGVTKNSTQFLQHHPTDDTESDYSIDYGKLTPVLINAVKELSTEIETLKAKVAALEGS